MDELDDEALLSSPQDILSLCGSLISLSEQGQVRLAHLSVKDYLLNSEACMVRFWIEPDGGNHQLAIDCLTYLSYRSLASGPSQTVDDYVDRLSQHPFIQHAATGWTYYVRATNPSPKLEDLILNLFSPGSHNIFMSWVQVINAQPISHWDFYPRYATPLYYAASFGLTAMVERLIKSGVDLDAPGSRFGGTALHAAIIRHHADVIKLLLEAGANPSKADSNRATPLHTAAAYGKVDAAAKLLEFGASKDAVDDDGETPYDWATWAGQIECQHLLLGLPVKPRTIVEGIADQKVSKRHAADRFTWKCKYPDPLALNTTAKDYEDRFDQDVDKVVVVNDSEPLPFSLARTETSPK